jgi:hypothetical protein
MDETGKHSSDWKVQYLRFVHFGDHADHISLPWEQSEAGQRVPVCESKMIHSYDHRDATFDQCSRKDIISGRPRLTSIPEKRDIEFGVQPRYFIDEEFERQLFSKYPDRMDDWLLTWRDVARNTDERTCIAAAIPRIPTSVSCPVLGTDPQANAALLLANLNSIILDYAARQKTSGIHLNFGILKQLPVIAHRAYSETDRVFIFERVAEAPHPDQQWMEQMGRNVTTQKWGFLANSRHLLHDRDSKFCLSFRHLIEAGKVKTMPLPARNPNLNAMRNAGCDR